jgi:hypothetical protein
VQIETLTAAITEAERFVKAARVVKVIVEKGDRFWDVGKENATVKRASMDLTRVLADLRQGR